MQATEQYSPVVLFIMLYKVALTFKLVDEIWKSDHSNESYRAVYFPVYIVVLILSLWMKSWSVTIQIKATEQYFAVVLFSLVSVKCK